MKNFIAFLTFSAVAYAFYIDAPFHIILAIGFASFALEAFISIFIPIDDDSEDSA